MTSPLIALAMASAVVAGSHAPSIEVRYKDLNLETPAGQEALDSRIKHAARQVCGLDDVTTGTRIPSAENRRCYEKALNSVSAAVAAATGKGREAS